MCTYSSIRIGVFAIHTTSKWIGKTTYMFLFQFTAIYAFNPFYSLIYYSKHGYDKQHKIIISIPIVTSI